MSTKRLTKSEMATYLFGEAVRRTLDAEKHLPEKSHQIEVLFQCIETALTEDELELVMFETGWLLGELGEAISRDFHLAPVPSEEDYEDDGTVPF